MPDIERDESRLDINALWTRRSVGIVQWIPVRGNVIACEDPYEEGRKCKGNDRRKDGPMRNHPRFGGEAIQAHIKERDRHLGCRDRQKESGLAPRVSLYQSISIQPADITCGGRIGGSTEFPHHCEDIAF